MKHWEVEMQGEFEKERRNHSYNIEMLFIKLEQIAKEYFDKGQMKDGDVFRFPTTYGIRYCMTFYHDFTEIGQIGLDNSIENLLKKEDYDNADVYKNAQTVVLSTIGKTLISKYQGKENSE